MNLARKNYGTSQGQGLQPPIDPHPAACWMRERLQQDGYLSQRDAALHLLQFGDERLAYIDHDESPCVGRLVLARFRAYPDVVYDRRAKCWTLKHR